MKTSTEGTSINNKSVLALPHTFKVTLSICAFSCYLIYAELAVTMFSTQSEYTILGSWNKLLNHFSFHFTCVLGEISYIIVQESSDCMTYSY